MRRAPSRDRGHRLVERWDQWVHELEEHPLDQHEYLGALQLRDELEEWLQISGDREAMDSAALVDARFEDLTDNDGRFARCFPEQAGRGSWWHRLPSDSAAQDYVLRA